MTTKKQKNEAPAFQIPHAPEGHKLIPMYKPMWIETPGTKVAGYPIAIQPEEKADGTKYQAIMLRLTSPVNVTLTDHTGTRQYEAKQDDLIALDGSAPCMEKIVALALSEEVHKIELWIVPTEHGPKKMLHVALKGTERGEVDPVVIAANKHAAEAAGANGAG